MTLFSCSELEVIEDFYDEAESERIYRQFLQEHHWPDNRYCVGGRQFTLPRLQTWHADPGIVYSYSNNLLQSRPWTPLLSTIKFKVEALLDFGFNAVLVNLYRNGDDHVGWHADNEPELGKHPVIASLSFGAERRFAFRRKNSPEHGYVPLGSGTLLLMRSGFQSHWLHSIPRDKSVVSGRINLTFRKVLAAPGPNIF